MPLELQTSMSQPPDPKQLSKEERVRQALQAIKSHQKLSVRRAATVYKVPQRTINCQYVGKQSPHNTYLKSSSLQKTEEEALKHYIKKLDAQGFAPTLRSVEDMANQLHAARSEKPVGPKWASNFVKCEGELKSRLSQQRDRQRVLCSDPEVIGPWFDLVQNIKAKYGCPILGVLRGPKTQVSDHWHHWMHQLASDAVMGYALGAWCCNLDGIQLFPFCIVGYYRCQKILATPRLV
jgi:hypothetical protein